MLLDVELPPGQAVTQSQPPCGRPSTPHRLVRGKMSLNTREERRVDPGGQLSQSRHLVEKTQPGATSSRRID